MRNRRRVKYIHQSIDYDRLAQAIVQAHEQIEKKKEEAESKLDKKILEEETTFCKKYRFPPLRFFIRVWKFLHAKESDGRFTSGWMSMLLHWFFISLAIVFGFLTIVLIPAIVVALMKLSWSGIQIFYNIMCLLAVVMIPVVTFLLTLFSLCTAKEVEVEKDRNYLSSVFSGIISLVALVISITALCYGLS